MEIDLEAMELCEGLDKSDCARLQAISRPRSLRPQEYLFLLGDHAECLYAVSRGRVDLCFPVSFGGIIRDVSIESIAAGRALGWSSLVKPYRFTLSARAAEPTDLRSFPSRELLALFRDLPQIGYIFMKRLAEVIGDRNLKLQALWARELQRAVERGLGQELPQGEPGSAQGTDPNRR